MELESRSQRIWGWPIAMYLFLGGLGGGCYLLGVLFDLFSSGPAVITKVGIVLGPPVVLIGVLFLAADLGRPAQAIRAIMRPTTSWISRGTIILTIFLLLGGIHIFLWIWPLDWLAHSIIVRKTLGAMGGLFAFLTILYTGLLLGALRPIPFWCSPLLPVLFLTSGLSTALMTIELGMAFLGAGGTLIHPSLIVLARFHIPLLILEGVMVAIYLQTGQVLEASRASIHKIIRGELAAQFWMGFFLLGLIIPFALAIFEQTTSFESLWLALLKAVPGLIGGYLLRSLILAGGVQVPLNVQGITVSPITNT
jgi:formate-dependent nitrite reductase membrane component NrfD